MRAMGSTYSTYEVLELLQVEMNEKFHFPKQKHRSKKPLPIIDKYYAHEAYVHFSVLTPHRKWALPFFDYEYRGFKSRTLTACQREVVVWNS